MLKYKVQAKDYSYHKDANDQPGGGGDSSEGFDPSMRGTLLKVQRFETVYDHANNKYVVREIEKEPVVESNKLNSSDRNIFNIWRRISPSMIGAPSITTKIDIKSSHLRDICRDVIGGYKNISWTAEPLKVCG